MRIIQNCYDQQSHSQYHHEFLICTHNTTPFRKTRNGNGARPPAARLNILYFQGAFPLRRRNKYIPEQMGICNIWECLFIKNRIHQVI